MNYKSKLGGSKKELKRVNLQLAGDLMPRSCSLTSRQVIKPKSKKLAATRPYDCLYNHVSTSKSTMAPN